MPRALRCCNTIPAGRLLSYVKGNELMSSFVELKGVYKRYRMGEVVISAADGVEFNIEQGEFAVIVGPSGAGKTTVLNMLGGMDTCDEGQILVDGSDISRYSRKELIGYRRYDVGFVFQFYNLVQNLTARENVELAAQICRDPLDAGEVLRQVGLGERMDNFPAQLSGGEQQRVAIARALATKPANLLADEPTGNLDSRTSQDVLSLMKVTGQRFAQTMVMITHNEEIAQLADRIVRIEDGRIVTR